MKLSIQKWLKQKFIKDIVKNSGILLTGSFGGSLIGLASFAIIIQYLGSTIYGQFVIVQTYMETFNQLFNFQCWQALITFGAQALEKKDITNFKQHLKIGVLFDITSAILGTLVALFLLQTAGIYFNWSDDQIFFTKLYSLLILFNIKGTPIGILRLLKKFKYISAHRLGIAVLKLITVIILKLLKVTPNTFIYTLIVLVLIEQLTLITIALIVLNKYHYLDFFKTKIGEWKNFVKFALWTNIESTINLPKNHFDKFLISKYLSYEAVSAFKIFKQFTQIIRKVTGAVYHSIFPDLSRKIAVGERKGAIKEGVKIGIILLVIGLPFYIIFVITSKWFVGPVFGYEFEKYYLLLVFYVGYNFSTVLFTSLEPLIISLGLVKHKVYINILSNAAFIGIILYIKDSRGLLGFVIADIIQLIILIVLKLILIIKKELRSEK